VNTKKDMQRKTLIGFAARRISKPGELIKRSIWPKKGPPPPKP
jgi:hypothetical protein